MIGRRLLGFAWGIAALSLAGCGAPAKHPSPAPAPDPPGTLRSKDGSVSLRMPEDWFAVDADAPAQQKLAATLGAANPQLKELEQQRSGTLLLGISLTTARLKAGVNDTVSVKSVPGMVVLPSSEAQTRQLQALLRTSLKAAGPVKVDIAKVGEDRAVHFVAEMRLKRPGNKTVAVYTIGFLVPHRGTTYTVTFTASPDRAKAMTRLANAAIQTLNLK